MGLILGLKIMGLKYPATQQQQWPQQLIDHQIKAAKYMLWVDSYSFCYHRGTNDHECSEDSYYSVKKGKYNIWSRTFKNQLLLHT